MRTDALQIEQFYRTEQGRAARAMMVRRLRALWTGLDGLDVLSIGYGPPLLESIEGQPRRRIAFMPAEQGAVRWPGDAPSRTVLGEESHLPFQDAMFDRVILVHALEESQSPAHLLRELWRITAPQGRIVLIAPNRAGLWARVETTPFGHGRPFSRGQLSQLLGDAAFTPTAWSRALHAPPWAWACKDDRALGWETFGEKLMPHLGGLILAEAVKNTGALTPRRVRPVRVRLPGLEGSPTPALSPRRTRQEDS
ncbi:methyltransferase domain-containing protein [Hyphobacterium sp. HN65]|uniref:Methyltransferase domain-containing protein n=1 Tax=Hyphobacterium lacteum TaxID=3116575 RepID=A0ABU7LQ14_9PROT|nr:methyltransferase domain-containing protein [Hyphobacterium sp. HN65]MEE2525997.1 methyltransferase domain-containing protein [Hyphobacterium sp. HN65]